MERYSLFLLNYKLSILICRDFNSRIQCRLILSCIVEHKDTKTYEYEGDEKVYKFHCALIGEPYAFSCGRRWQAQLDG